MRRHFLELLAAIAVVAALAPAPVAASTEPSGQSSAPVSAVDKWGKPLTSPPQVNPPKDTGIRAESRVAAVVSAARNHEASPRSSKRRRAD